MHRNPAFAEPYDRDLYWKTKEGVLIPLSEMQESHLRNAIAYMKRRNVKEEMYHPLEKELEFRRFLAEDENSQETV